MPSRERGTPDASFGDSNAGVMVQEKLRFPSGTATAKVIRMLHGGAALDEADEPPPRTCTLPVVGEVRIAYIVTH